jgi:hypothetical protein
MVFLEQESNANKEENVNSTSMCAGNNSNTNEDDDQDILSSTLTSENEYQNQSTMATSHQQAVSIKSVKEHAKKLNRLSTELKIFGEAPNKQNVARQQQQQSISESTNSRNYVRVVPKNLEIESFNFSDVIIILSKRWKQILKSLLNLKPKPHEKEWILLCSKGDYMEMAKILSKQPYLAQKRDPFTVNLRMPFQKLFSRL